MTTVARTIDNYRHDVSQALHNNQPNHIAQYQSSEINRVLVQQHAGTDWEEHHCLNYSNFIHDRVRGCWEHHMIEAGLPLWLDGTGIHAGIVVANTSINANRAFRTFGGTLSLAREREIKDFLITTTQRHVSSP